MTIINFIIVTIVAVILFTTGLLYFLLNLTWMPSMEKSQCCKMKLSTVKKLYAVNPEKWQCSSDIYNYALTYDSPHGQIWIKLSFIDQTRLHFTKFRYNKFKTSNAQNKNLAYLLKDAQRDINKLLEQSIEETYLAHDKMIEIERRLRENENARMGKR